MSRINAVKFRLENARKRTEQWEDLTRQREEIEAAIQNFSSDMKEKRRNFSRAPSKKIEEGIKKMENLISELKLRLRELDHLIDQIEEYKIDHVAKIRTELIEEILTLHPDEIAPYQEMNARLEENQSKEAELNEVYLSIHQIESLLKVILDERSCVKKRGILRYILGKSPNFIITKCLETAKELSEDALKVIEGSAESVEHEEIRALLELFIQECSGKWSFTKIDSVFKETSDRLEVLLSTLKLKQEKLQIEIHEQENKLELWMNQW